MLMMDFMEYEDFLNDEVGYDDLPELNFNNENGAE